MTKIEMNALFTISLNKAIGGGMTANVCKSGLVDGVPKVSMYVNRERYCFLDYRGLWVTPVLGITGKREPGGSFLGPFEASVSNAELLGKLICDKG